MRIRQYEAGTPIADIAQETGLSTQWVYTKIGRHRSEPKTDRDRHHLEAMRRELIRAETDLMCGNVEGSVKRMRALAMLIKLESEFNQCGDAATGTPVEADDFTDAKVELERRLARLRAASAGKSLAELGYEEPSEGVSE